MLHKEICFSFLFLFYLKAIEADFVPELQNAIKHFVSIKNTNDKSVLKVQVDESEEVEIFYSKSNNRLMDKATALYTAVSCKIANWNMHNIYEFIKFSPLFYHFKFQNYINLYEEEFKFKFNSDLKLLKSFIDRYAVKFMNVLQNILDTYEEISFYNDISVLKSLISLRIKVNLMSFDSERQNNINIKSDFDKIRFLLEDMNTFQRFFSTYCVNTSISASKRNSWFYGYWLQIDNEKSYENPDSFFKLTKNLYLELENPKDCLLEHMFLDIFVYESPIGDCIGYDIFNAKVTYANGVHSYTYLPIKDILNYIKISQDSDTVFFYQDLIFATVMKLIFTKTKKLLDEFMFGLPTSVKENIDTLSKIISDDEAMFPPYFTEGIRILSAYISNRKLETKEFKYFYNFSLNFIKLNILCSNISDTEYLNELIMKVIKNIDALKCFHKSYKYIHDKRGIYYKSFAFNRSKYALSFNKEDINRSKQVCNFVINLYSMCYQVLLIYSDDYYTYVTTGNSSAKMTFELLSIIRHYFLLIIQKLKETDYLSLLQMAYNIAPLLVNKLERCNNIHCISDIKRILSIIMTNLNNFGLPYCTVSKKNLLLFNNINFLIMGDHYLIEKSTLDFFQSVINDFSYNDLISYNVLSEDYNYLSISYLKNNFMKNSYIFDTYENRIQFYLNGQTQTIKEIYKDATSLLLNSQNYYNMFFDIYFKFYIAVIYYELKKNLNSTTLPKLYEITRISNTLSNFTFDCFPPELNYLVSHIKSLLDLSTTRILVTESELTEFTDKIDKQFKLLNIYFKDHSSIMSCSFESTFYSNDSIKPFVKINNELLENLPVITNLIEKYLLWKPSFQVNEMT